MFFGMFGSIFLLAQFLQVVQHYSPLQAGLRTLPWTAMPVFVAPIAGALSDRIGGRPLLVTGLALQAIGLGWLAAVISPTVSYAHPGARRSSSPASACPCSSRPSPTSCSARCGGTRRASPPARTTRSGNWAACSGSPCSARCSPPAAVTPAGRRSSPAWPPAVWVGAAAVAVAAAAALLLPRLRKTEASPAAEASLAVEDSPRPGSLTRPEREPGPRGVRALRVYRSATWSSTALTSITGVPSRASR